MKVSIITSVYNCQKYILEMIESIINQTYTDWEMIIIDDASIDCTWDLIEKVDDKRIIKIRNNENLGLTKNLNIAMSLASGEYILRVDGDDVAMPNRIEKQVAYMEKYNDVILSGTWMRSFGLQYDILKSALQDEELRVRMILNSVIYHPTFILRSKELKKYNIRYNERMEFAQDYDMIFQLCKYGKIANIPEVLMKYRMSDAQISMKKRKKQIENANITRRKILSELEIELSDEIFRCWVNFCVGSMGFVDRSEIDCIRDIIDKIDINNRKKCIYNVEILNKVLNNEFERYLKKICPQNEQNINLEWQKKYFQVLKLMNQWIRLKQRGKNLAEYLTHRNYREIAIYGMGEVGESLISELHNSDIVVKYAIDINKDMIFSPIKIYGIEDEYESVDVLIVTAVYFFKEIKRTMNEKIKCPIISLEEIVYEMK